MYSYRLGYQGTGGFAVYAGTAPARAKEVLGLMNDELDRWPPRGRAKASWWRRAPHPRRHRPGPGGLGRSHEPLGPVPAGARPGTVLEELDGEIAAVTTEDLARVAALRAGRPPQPGRAGPFDRAFGELPRGTAVLRVGVFGAAGRMGAAVCAGVRADPQLELVAVVDPACAGGAFGLAAWSAGSRPRRPRRGRRGDRRRFHTPTAGPPMLGTARRTVSTPYRRHRPGGGGSGRAAPASGGRNPCVLAPNFAIGAVLLMRFADSPPPGSIPWRSSNCTTTAGLRTLLRRGSSSRPAQHSPPPGPARRRGQRRDGQRAAAGLARRRPPPAPDPGPQLPSRGLEGAPGVRVHSVRLRGLVAHQEVLLGTTGQVLTLATIPWTGARSCPGCSWPSRPCPSPRALPWALTPCWACERPVSGTGSGG